MRSYSAAMRSHAQLRRSSVVAHVQLRALPQHLTRDTMQAYDKKNGSSGGGRGDGGFRKRFSARINGGRPGPVEAVPGLARVGEKR